MGAAETPIEAARQAFARRSWEAARTALADLRAAVGLEADDLWRLAVSALLTGRGDECVSALESAHQAYLKSGRTLDAVRCAFWIGQHLMSRGDAARATGWFARAARVAGPGDSEGLERAYLLIPEAHRQFATGQHEEAARSAAKAVDLAERHHDPDALALAIHLRGRALLRMGALEEGLRLLDEAMVAVTADELSPIMTGLVYCSVIGACREVYALDRAQEWTTALEDWCAGQPEMVAYSGQCRGYRSEILLRAGAWRASIAEARRAAAMYERGSDPGSAGFAHYQAGEAHRLLGELDEAEAAYRDASRSGHEPQPGLSLLRLARGDAKTAQAGIRRALAETSNPLTRARLLPAYVEIMIAAGEIGEAERAASELEAIATRCVEDALGPKVAQCRGAVALAAGSAEEALAPLRAAWHAWQSRGVPYEAARTRVLLGRACRALGDVDGAALELAAARDDLARLGASVDLAALDAPTRSSSGESFGLTPRESEVLELVATGRTNRAIGEELFISEKTVARHVANIFGKLGLSSRAEATAFAYEHGLVRRSTQN